MCWKLSSLDHLDWDGRSLRFDLRASPFDQNDLNVK